MERIKIGNKLFFFFSWSPLEVNIVDIQTDFLLLYCENNRMRYQLPRKFAELLKTLFKFQSF